MNQTPPPWYRQFWPWLLIALPASAVIASIVTVIIAVKNPDGLVVGDYYKQGLAINQTLARDRHARFLGLAATGQLGAGGQIRLDLTGRQPVAVQRLKLSLLHPTRANQDQVIWLQMKDDGVYQGKLTPPGPARWHLLLEPAEGQWRLTGRLAWPGEGRIDLRPARTANSP